MPSVEGISATYPRDPIDPASQRRAPQTAQTQATVNDPPQSRKRDDERERVERHKGTHIDRRA
jgi:hypothetical protein